MMDDGREVGGTTTTNKRGKRSHDDLRDDGRYNSARNCTTRPLRSSPSLLPRVMTLTQRGYCRGLDGGDFGFVVEGCGLQ